MHLQKQNNVNSSKLQKLQMLADKIRYNTAYLIAVLTDKQFSQFEQQREWNFNNWAIRQPGHPNTLLQVFQ